jgi:hypothetical protein
MTNKSLIPRHLFAYMAIFHSDWKEYHSWIENLPDENPASLTAINANRSTKEMQSLLAKQLQDAFHQADVNGQRNLADSFTVKWPYLTHGHPTDTYVTFKIGYHNYEYYILDIIDDRKQVEPANFTFPHLIGEENTLADFPYSELEKVSTVVV